MRSLKLLLAGAVAAAALIFAPAAVTPAASAQVSFGINIGAEPVCPYGYYGYAPYNCAPYGYYGPQWFNNGAFIGAGRWYRGRRGFYGPVNRRFDPRYGYRGGFPGRGERFDDRHDFHDFRGNGYGNYHGHYRGGGHHGHHH